MIYLDNAATSFPKPPGMTEKMLEHMAAWCGNPGRAGHDMSRKTAEAIEKTRQLLAEFIGANDPSRIIFTQNATSALNMAIHGTLLQGDHVITTSMEHNSVLRPIISSGADYTIVPCGSDGSLEPALVEAAIRSNTRMIACTHASNVTGTIMPIDALVEICRKHNLSRRHRQQDCATQMPRNQSTVPRRSVQREILLLVDASQTLGHIPVGVGSSNDASHSNCWSAETGFCGIDLLAAPGHKGLMGPMGTGFLYVRPGLNLKPLMQGGTGTYSKLLEPPLEFPESFEAGTINAPGIIGLGYSLKYLQQYSSDSNTSKACCGVSQPGSCQKLMPTIRQSSQGLVSMLDDSLRNMKGVTVYGPSDCQRKVGIVTFNIDGRDSRDVASLLNDNFGIATRAGFHCAGLAHKTIGTWDTGAVRMSLGLFNNMRQVKLAIDAVYKISKLQPGTPPAVLGPGCRR